jgi:monoamine oxidase
MRDPFTHGLYAEAGAMRIPRSHKLTLAYVEKFGLPTHDFTMSNPEGWCHLFGRKHRFREVEAKPHLIGGHLDERDIQRADDPARRGCAGETGRALQLRRRVL